MNISDKGQYMIFSQYFNKHRLQTRNCIRTDDSPFSSPLSHCIFVLFYLKS